MKKVIYLMENLPEILDAALITSGYNRRYYTEFPSSAGTLLVTREESYLIIDARYFEAAKEQVKNCTVVLQGKLFDQIEELSLKHGVRRLGIESDTVTLSQNSEYSKRLPSLDIVTDRTLSQFINEQRAVKCDTEKEYMQISQDITDKTFDYALEIIKEGKTEKEIALQMEMYSRENGSEEAAFAFIVASGPNTSRPHAVPSDRKVQKGDFVLMDFGSTYKGYRSDMTRTVAVGAPSDKQVDVYNTVLKAQLESMKLIRAGVKLVDVHNKAAEVIDNSPYKGLFTHGLGHSLGLEVHEPPNFNAIATESAVVGNVITVEPGIYITGEFGVRIEDFVYITEDSFYNFTGSPKKELIIL